MTNQQFLNKIIQLYELIYTKDIVLLINLEGAVLFASSNVELVIGKSPNQIIGKNYLDVLPLPKENIPKIIDIINNIISTGNTREILSINLNHSLEFSMLQVVLKPVINPENNVTVAINIESRKVNFPIYFHKMIMFMESQPKRLSQVKHTDKFLTLREHEIGFLLFYCKNAQHIAQILSALYEKPVSSKTINNIIRQQLYVKFKVYNIESLENKLYQMGYHKKFPASFLCNTLLDLNKL